MAAQEVLQKHGKNYYAAANGRLFHAATAKTGVAPGTDLSTTAGFALHNPYGSGVNLNIRKASVGYISGTLGAGTIFHAINRTPVNTVPSGTAISEIPGNIGSGAVAKGVALTTATVVAPEIIRPFVSLQASLASTAVAPWQATEEMDGDIIVSPGCTYILHAVAAAGTSPLVAYGVTWEEVPEGAD